ncbi:hypothetical protein [Streptomyces sp. NPDC087512]
MNVIDVPGTPVRTQATWSATYDWLAAPRPRGTTVPPCAVARVAI